MKKRSREGINRRGFLAGSMAAASAPFLLAPRHAVAGAAGTAPSEKLNIGAIGIGGMGGSNIRNLAKDNNITALCDVDTQLAAKVFNAFPDARTYTDYREMLAEEDDMDGVVIATPDHTHAVIAAAAMRAGKHVFCQKPLAHDVWECRRLAEIAKETGVVTQMGIQGHAGEGIRQVAEWVAAGVIGEVRQVEAWCLDTYYPWGHASWSPKEGAVPAGTPPVPETLDWDLWLGPAQERPYHPCYHPRAWRAFVAFGSGWMADRGAHTLDPVCYALKLGLPTRIDATTTGMTEEMHPVSAVVRFEFPARAGMPPVDVTWYTGLRPPRPRSIASDETFGDATGGVIFLGSEGTLSGGTYCDGPKLHPESRMKNFKPPKPTIPRVQGGIEADWVRAIKEGDEAVADFGYSARLSEVCMLGNAAKRAGGTIDYDAARMKVTNMPDANQYLRTPYREGWTL